MSDAILFINTLKVPTAEMTKFKKKLQKAVDFLKTNGPQLMVETYVDTAQERAYSFQLYSDSASIQTHWQISDPYIREVMEHATVERLDIYGTPTHCVMRRVQEFSNEGVEISVTPNVTGFHRFIPPHPPTPAL